MTRRGRPRGALGPESLAVLSLASVRTVTYLDAWREIGLSRDHASETVRRGRRDGWLVAVGTIVVPGSVRPIVQVRAAPATVEAKLDALMQWSHRIRSSS